ncbi:MAG: hypothetical protein L6R28_23420 [Planctomycetes bacterium]|nr:hypothetical protein [Planctomycetota bacterium]
MPEPSTRPMWSGRHLLLAGLLAAAGLLAIRDSQTQVGSAYRIAELEHELQNARKAIQLEKMRLQLEQAPKTVMRRVKELDLAVQPASELSVYHAREENTAE